MSQPAKPPSIIDLYPEETREAAELLKQAVPLMMRHDIPPNPVHYALWYTYSRGSEPELNRRLDKVVEDFDWSTPKTKQAISLLEAVGASTKTLVVLSTLDGVAGRSFRNLPDVIMCEPGHLTPYDVLWADQVVFTSHTVGSVGQTSTYEVSDEDFVKDDGGES